MRAITCGLIAMAFFSAAAPGRAEVTGDLGALPLVAERHRANKDALRTWRGRATVRFESFAQGAPEHERVITHDVEFVLDRDAGSRRCRIRSRGSVTLHVDDMIKRPRPPQEGHGLAHGDTIAEVMAVPVGAKPFRVAIRHRQEGADQGVAMPGRFDPMYWLENAEADVAERATFFHDGAREIDNPWTVRRDKDLVTIAAESAERRPPLTNHYVIDLSKGASLVSFRSSQSGESLWAYEYEQVGGLWMLKRSSFRLSDKDGGRVMLKVAEFHDTRVNEPINPAEFTLEAMGVPDGCEVVDERPERRNAPDRSYRYKARQMVGRADTRGLRRGTARLAGPPVGMTRHSK